MFADLEESGTGSLVYFYIVNSVMNAELCVGWHLPSIFQTDNTSLLCNKETMKYLSQYKLQSNLLQTLLLEKV